MNEPGRGGAGGGRGYNLLLYVVVLCVGGTKGPTASRYMEKLDLDARGKNTKLEN